MVRLFFSTLTFLYSTVAFSGGSSSLEMNDYARSFKNEGAVATVHPLATKNALDILAGGGNAVDAALAAAFTLGVVDSHNSGVGGGCFILARLANGEIIALDGREMAPQKSTRDMYIVNGKVDKSLSKTGALAVGVPGSVQALFELQKLAGKKEFADVLLPAAIIAEKGFKIDNTLAKRLASTADRLNQFPASAAIFLNAKGKPLTSGDLLKQTDLAKSYRKLAKLGPEWFYRGEFARKTADWMKQNKGVLEYSDFTNYKTVKREPVHSTYNGYEVYGFSPPSSGGVHVAQILNILSQFPLRNMSTSERYHVIAESMRLAFADRAHWLGDSDFVPVPRGLFSMDYAKHLAKKINPKAVLSDVQYSVPPNAADDIFGKHTTHIATADKFGNWVSITTTLNTSFGSKVVVPGTGILLNNQMDDFSAQPGVPNAFGLVGAQANAIAGGKRPLSSMSPTLVLKDGKPVLTLGAAGGPTIITQVVQTLVQKLLFDVSLYDAVAAPRVHQIWRPNMLFVDKKMPEEVTAKLKALGHPIREAGDFGGTQAVSYENGRFFAVTEPRVVERNQ